MVDYYSDIRMGDWGFPVHIGCFNYCWTLYCDAYDYDRPTKNGCELLKSNDKMWLFHIGNNYSIFDIYDYESRITPIGWGVSKPNCMDLYKKVMGLEWLIIGLLKGNYFYNVYQYNENYTESKLRMLSFSDYKTAIKYKDFLVRIPYNRYQTTENMMIEQISREVLKDVV